MIGLTDYATGEEISFSIFYLLPVAVTTWFVGRSTGLFFAVIGAISWLAADLFGGHRYSHPAIPYWNMMVRFGFFLIVLIIMSRLKSALESERILSGVDPLTGAANARAFQERARTEIDRSRRYGRPFTLAYVDLDNFKAVNDRFGHSAGDNLLRLMTDIIQKNLRTTDIFARVGGDEFVLLLPETGQESARAVLDKLRDKVTSSLQEAESPVTLSVGAVIYLSPPDSVDSMILQADNLMYQAKHSGKNRIRQEVYAG
ncbi:MAG: GGDEF domain-containing protein [Candidatus Deferrimicrobiaceae bacterium]